MTDKTAHGAVCTCTRDIPNQTSVLDPECLVHGGGVEVEQPQYSPGGGEVPGEGIEVPADGTVGVLDNTEPDEPEVPDEPVQFQEQGLQ